MPQRRQNSMVRGPTMSILGCSMAPSVFSISVQAMPRQPSSPASASPTGPAPTIRTGVRSLTRSVSTPASPRRSSLGDIFPLERVVVILLHQPLPLGEIGHHADGLAHVSLAPEF